jgi:hypothetical protein
MPRQPAKALPRATRAGQNEWSMDGLAEWLRRLHGSSALSRNRNFELFEKNRPARQAQRRHLRLLALARDLRRYVESEGTVRLRGALGQGGIVEVEVPSVRFRRRIFVDAIELELLGEDPGLARLLGLPRPAAE